MSFNTSYIQADTLSTSTSTTIAGHLLSNGVDDSLTLGGISGIMTMTQLNSDVVVSGTVSANTLIPTLGVGSDMAIDGNLDMSSYDIKQVKGISDENNSFGTSGQVLKSDGAKIYWASDAQGDVSQWATYQAVQDVDMNDKNLSNVATISSSGDNFTTFTSQVSIQNYLDLTSYGITALGSISTSANGLGTVGQVLKTDGVNVSWADDAQADVGQWATFEAVQDVDMNDKNLASVNSVECQSTVIENVAKTEQINLSYGFSQIEPSISALVVSDPNQEYAYISTNGNIEALNSVSTQVFGIINPINISGEFLGKFSNLGDNTGSYLQTDIISLKRRSNKLLYVSSATSGDIFQDGQILTPFSTIQKALDYINTNYNGTYYYIQLQNGVYSESFTITKPCFIQGLGKSTYEDGVGCQITGTITLNCPTSGNLFNTCFNLSGVLLNGYINNVSTGDVCLNLRDVYIYSSGSSIIHNPSGLSRLRVQDCYFNSVNTSSTDPLLDIRSGSSLLMSNTVVSAKGLQSCLKFSASATCDTVVNCKFECSNTSASVEPLVLVAGTASATFTFTYCGFLYSSSTSKSANALASGIYNTSATGNNQIVSLYNSFFLLGTDTTLNFAIQDGNYGTARAMIVLYYMCGASLANAFSIKGIQNTNKFQLNIVS